MASPERRYADKISKSAASAIQMAPTFPSVETNNIAWSNGSLRIDWIKWRTENSIDQNKKPLFSRITEKSGRIVVWHKPLLFLGLGQNFVQIFHKENGYIGDDAGGDREFNIGEHSQFPGVKSADLILTDKMAHFI